MTEEEGSDVVCIPVVSADFFTNFVLRRRRRLLVAANLGARHDGSSLSMRDDPGSPPVSLRLPPAERRGEE